MRRADRLFQLVQILRRGRVTTAARIAEEMEVSERTVYRDVADLVANGVPVEGEAGVGYVLPASFDLPPLLFDAQEIEALVVGARLVTTWTDSELARAAKSALVKVEHVLPDRLKSKLGRTRLFAPEFARAGDHAALPAIRAALEEERVLAFDYTDEAARASERRARPLGLFFWGKVWTLAAWCETRNDFRTFRVDRMREARATDERFQPEPGRTLEDYVARASRDGEDDTRSRSTSPNSAAQVRALDRAADHPSRSAEHPVRTPRAQTSAARRSAPSRGRTDADDRAQPRADRHEPPLHPRALDRAHADSSEHRPAATETAPRRSKAGRSATSTSSRTRDEGRATNPARRRAPRAPVAHERPEFPRAKPPKLALDADERAALRGAGLAARDVAELGADELARRVDGALSRARCAELVALARFQRLGSVGLETARDLLVLGITRVEDLAGRDARTLHRELERRTRTKHDPCVEDVFRCAIAQAEEPELAPELRDWWRWTSLRGAAPDARPAAPSTRRASNASERTRRR